MARELSLFIGTFTTLLAIINSFEVLPRISQFAGATMLVTYLYLAYASKLSEKLGTMGIDAITRIVGFFVSAMGVALIFDGVIEALESHGVTTLH